MRKTDAKPIVVEPETPVPAAAPSTPAPEPRKEVEPEKPKPAPKEVAKAKAPEPERPAPAPAASNGDQPPSGQTFLQLAATTQREADIMIDVLRKKGFKARAAEIPGKCRDVSRPRGTSGGRFLKQNQSGSTGRRISRERGHQANVLSWSMNGLVQIAGARQRLPEWLRKPRTHFEAVHDLKAELRRLRLHTVCESARCPNMHECFDRGAATFMILGNLCTRGCGFCSVPKSRHPGSLDADEPSECRADGSRDAPSLCGDHERQSGRPSRWRISSFCGNRARSPARSARISC